MEETNNQSKKSYFIGICIVLAAFVLGLMLVVTVRTLKSFDDTVRVRGLCEKEVPADRVVLRVGYSTQGDELAQVRAQIEANNKIIIDLLKKAGIKDEEIMYGSPSISDNYAQTYYGNNQPRYRYDGSQSIRIATTNMDVVRKLEGSLEGDLLKMDIIANAWADYQFLGLNEIKPSMIAESLEKAREAADEFANNSHSKIGKMRTASQGVFEIEDLDENTPQMKKVRVVSTVEYYLK